MPAKPVKIIFDVLHRLYYDSCFKYGGDDIKEIFLWLAVLTVLGASACSQRAWHEGAKQSQRNECYKMPPSARGECLKALDSESYDEYQRQRQEELKK